MKFAFCQDTIYVISYNKCMDEYVLVIEIHLSSMWFYRVRNVIGDRPSFMIENFSLCPSTMFVYISKGNKGVQLSY